MNSFRVCLQWKFVGDIKEMSHMNCLRRWYAPHCAAADNLWLFHNTFWHVLNSKRCKDNTFAVLEMYAYSGFDASNMFLTSRGTKGVHDSILHNNNYFGIGVGWFCTALFLFEWMLDCRLTCTSHTAQSWRPVPPRRCWCCPRRESPPSAWPAHPAGPAAFGRWTGSPLAVRTVSQAVADCLLRSGSMRMYRHIPKPGCKQGHGGVEGKKKKDSLTAKPGMLMADGRWIIKHAGTVCALSLTSFCTPVIVRLAWRREYVSRFTPSQVSPFP